MKTLIALLVAVSALLPAAARAEHAKRGGAAMPGMARIGALVVERAWARSSLTGNGAAYVTVRNTGTAMDRLVGIRTPVAARAELHTHSMDKGIMRMRQLSAIEIHPGAPAVMRPGGNHIMLIGLTSRLRKGGMVALTLVFEKAGAVTVQARILGPGARGPAAGPGGGHKQHQKKGGHTD